MNQFILNAYFAVGCRELSLEEFLISQKLLELDYDFKSIEFSKCCPRLSRFYENFQPKDFVSARDKLLRSADTGIQFTYPGHELYPESFLNLEQTPFLIRYLGAPLWKSKCGLAVVGSREPSTLSLNWMEQCIPKILSGRVRYIVSGGARGVDQKAHSLALRNGVPTMALLPSGLKNIYPRPFADWVKPILESGGALMSQYEDDLFMQKHFFLERNRLIAALGVCTLIVEAKKQSGTMITARQTLEQGKTVLVLPSHPFDTNSAGGLDLLFEGAQLIRDSKDLNSVLESEFIRI